MRFSGLICAALLATAATSASAQSADLAITMTNTSTTTQAGASTLYKIVVNNNGPDPASDVIVTVVLPNTLKLVAFYYTAGWDCRYSFLVPGDTITCSLPALAKGSWPTIEMTALLSSSATGILSNTATISATTPDSDPTNNAATHTDTIIPYMPPPAPVPTLSQWALILLGSLLTGGAALHLHRRRQTA